MDNLPGVLEVLVRVIDLTGIAVLVIGLLHGMWKFVGMEWGRIKGEARPIGLIQLIRCDVGIYILLALDIMIAADIIDSMVHTDVQDLINLGAIVLIRTVIGYFLGKEIAEIHQRDD